LLEGRGEGDIVGLLEGWGKVGGKVGKSGGGVGRFVGSADG